MIGSNPIPVTIPWPEMAVPVRVRPGLQNEILKYDIRMDFAISTCRDRAVKRAEINLELTKIGNRFSHAKRKIIRTQKYHYLQGFNIFTI